MLFLDYYHPFVCMKMIEIIFVETCFSRFQKECDNYIIRSTTHDKCFQLLRKSTLSPFDEK